MPITTNSPRKRPKGGKGGRKAPALVLAVFATFLVLVAATLWFISGSVPDEQPPSVGGPFQLINGDGRVMTDRDFRGKYMLIYFGYTFCPDVCPTTLQDVTTALIKLGPKAAMIQPIFITVDPKRDTPAVMKQYTAAFSSQLVGLTGTTEQIKAVEAAYHVYASQHPADTSSAAPGTAKDQSYTVDHSSILYLMGPDGHFVAPIRADEPGAAIAADLDRSVQPLSQTSKEKS